MVIIEFKLDNPPNSAWLTMRQKPFTKSRQLAGVAALLFAMWGRQYTDDSRYIISELAPTGDIHHHFNGEFVHWNQWLSVMKVISALNTA